MYKTISLCVILIGLVSFAGCMQTAVEENIPIVPVALNVEEAAENPQVNTQYSDDEVYNGEGCLKPETVLFSTEEEFMEALNGPGSADDNIIGSVDRFYRPAFVPDKAVLYEISVSEANIAYRYAYNDDRLLFIWKRNVSVDGMLKFVSNNSPVFQQVGNYYVLEARNGHFQFQWAQGEDVLFASVPGGMGAGICEEILAGNASAAGFVKGELVDRIGEGAGWNGAHSMQRPRAQTRRSKHIPFPTR
ncbi:hypothetical protein LJC27_00810 [Christensenellaceae bacterium OttesenSCG-928-M15]|nr:hypothetical protein [Christensenellaceae bacterium OttesenSCG-928-M15]